MVTSFRYRAHPVSTVTAGMALYPRDMAADVLRFLRDFMVDAPDDLFVVASFTVAPPAPFVPAELRGKPAVALGVCHCGTSERAERDLAPLRAFAQPAADLIHVTSFRAAQHVVDASHPAGRCSERTGCLLDALNDTCIDALLAGVATMTSPLSSMQIISMGGAIDRVPPEATATAHRGAAFAVEIFADWADPDEGERHLRWVRNAISAVRPFARSDTNVNFLTDGDKESVRAAYGLSTYERLAELKRRYDPANVFHLNRNIRPA